MRTRLSARSLLVFALASCTIAACSAPFSAGTGGGASDDSDGGAEPSTHGTSGREDGGTVVIPPGSSSGGSHGSSGGEDASPPDATLDAPSEGDATVDATEPESPDARADAHEPPPDAGPACPASEKLCGNTCVDKTNPAYGCAATSCTPCSVPKATATCDAAGACAVDACAEGYAHCTGAASGGCETPVSTPTNCGACGAACGAAEPYCALNASAGTYACTDDCPTASPTLCGSTCVNLASTVADCGGCTTSSKSYACTAPANGTATCGAGACGFTCKSGYSACNDDACVSLTTDPTNCGACAHICPTPAEGTATCGPVNGVGTCGIACTPPYSACNGACEDELTDIHNCGACANVCPTPAHGTATCAPLDGVGACGITCSAPYSACSGACVDEQNDVNNCGGCGKPCSAPANATATCGAATAGTCGFTCDANYQLCNGACVAPDPAAVFVSPSTVTTQCGGISGPCGTIASALAYAALTGKTHLILDHGTYPEQVTLPDGVTLEGGWIYNGSTASPPWTKECATGKDPSALAILAPTSTPMVVVANDVTATLTNLTIHNASSAGAGASLYGIFAASTGSTVDTHVTLNAVEIVVGNAGSGVAGGQGTAPALPSQNASPCSAGDGAGGASASAGAPKAASYSHAGYLPATGGAGGAGNAGDNGLAGGAGTCVGAQECDSDGCSATTACGGQGSNGCGGSGGAPGLGGSGGGASVALYAWQATVQINGGSLTAGNGGAGGAGGPGAAPLVPPTTGINGDGTIPTCTRPKGSVTCTGGREDDGIGGMGTTGGAGSNGGAGAAGTGGDSYSYYAGGGATVTPSGSPTFAFGAAGTSPAGATYSGHAADHN